MDPDETLRELRVLTRRLLDAAPHPAAATADAIRLAELVEALDDWLSRGGFPPRAWAAGHRPPPETGS